MLTPLLLRLLQYGIKKIILVGPGPIFQESLPSYLVRRNGDRPLLLSSIVNVPTHVKDPSHRATLDSEMRRLAHLIPQIQYLSIYETFCGKGACETTTDHNFSHLTFSDNQHLTVYGARIIVGEILTSL